MFNATIRNSLSLSNPWIYIDNICSKIDNNYVDFNHASAIDQCYNELNEADECEIGPANHQNPYIEFNQEFKIKN